jgi:hypothetical protein
LTLIHSGGEEEEESRCDANWTSTGACFMFSAETGFVKVLRGKRYIVPAGLNVVPVVSLMMRHRGTMWESRLSKIYHRTVGFFLWLP